jgi:hypothetical protein
MIPKELRTQRLKDLRGISLCDTLGKWYMSTLIADLQRWTCILKDPASHWPVIFSYGPQFGSGRVVVALQALCLRGNEWCNRTPVYILSADIKSAFDNVLVTVVLEAFEYWKAAPDIFAGKETPTFTFGWFRQGGSESTKLFGILIRTVMVKVRRLWQQLQQPGLALSYPGLAVWTIWSMRTTCTPPPEAYERQ